MGRVLNSVLFGAFAELGIRLWTGAETACHHAARAMDSFHGSNGEELLNRGRSAPGMLTPAVKPHDMAELLKILRRAPETSGALSKINDPSVPIVRASAAYVLLACRAVKAPHSEKWGLFQPDRHLTALGVDWALGLFGFEASLVEYFATTRPLLGETGTLVLVPAPLPPEPPPLPAPTPPAVATPHPAPPATAAPPPSGAVAAPPPVPAAAPPEPPGATASPGVVPPAAPPPPAEANGRASAPAGKTRTRRAPAKTVREVTTDEKADAPPAPRRQPRRKPAAPCTDGATDGATNGEATPTTPVPRPRARRRPSAKKT